MKIFEQLGYLRNRWVLCQHLEIRAAVPEIFNQLSNQLCELPTKLVKYLKNCYSDHLMLAEDPPVPEMIWLLKYFHDFTEFIYQDSKTPAWSCNNTKILNIGIEYFTTETVSWDYHF
jgi:hypothetical protein